jgi:signal transduction histidine kinase
VLELPDYPLPSLTTDPMALESIFGNLITNAINYTQKGGEIFVTAGLAENNLIVKVKDNGFGIEQPYIDKIFDKFFRVKNEKTRLITGTGLGLPIVKGLLNDLGGSVSVESAPGSGSVFTVSIPVNKQ